MTGGQAQGHAWMPKRTFNNLPAGKREAIIRVVLEEFSENGYRKAGSNTIVGRLGHAHSSLPRKS